MPDCVGWAHCTTTMERRSELCPVILNWMSGWVGVRPKISNSPLSDRIFCMIIMLNMASRARLAKRLNAAFTERSHGNFEHILWTNKLRLEKVVPRLVGHYRIVVCRQAGLSAAADRDLEGISGQGGFPLQLLPVRRVAGDRFSRTA